jgi:hypothetical protein
MNRSNRLSTELPKPNRKPDPKPQAAPAGPAAQPLTARRGVFILLSIAFAAWIGFLLYLYFMTVRAH